MGYNLGSRHRLECPAPRSRRKLQPGNARGSASPWRESLLEARAPRPTRALLTRHVGCWTWRPRSKPASQNQAPRKRDGCFAHGSGSNVFLYFLLFSKHRVELYYFWTKKIFEISSIFGRVTIEGVFPLPTPVVKYLIISFLIS